jgi:hypothetical protein
MIPISIPSTRGMINSSVEVYNDNDGSKGVLFTIDGWGEIGKTTHAGGSIPDNIEKGGIMPGGLLVINVQKPADGYGSVQPERVMDAYDWMVTNYPKADLSRIGATGLSLGGGAIYAIMANPSWAKKFAALVPVAGTKDATWQDLIAGVKASGTAFRAYGSSQDNNTPTKEPFNTYSMVAGGFDSEKILLKYGKFIDLFVSNGITNHTSTWPAVYNFSNTDFWNWLLSQKRTDVAAAPVVQPTPTPAPPVTPARKKLNTITIVNYDSGAPDVSVV